MTIEALRTAVSEEMVRRFGISWQDADGGEEPLREAMAAGEGAAEFVERWGEKYGLERRRPLAASSEQR